jgi:hypothetical protein
MAAIEEPEGARQKIDISVAVPLKALTQFDFGEE